MNRLKAPRWLKISGVVFAALISLFYLAGGFVFANMIHADALTPEPPTMDLGVYVTAVSEELITLTSNEVREDITRPGVAGLWWEGGYGRLGDIQSVDGLEVTRAFDVVSGPPPEPCIGDLDGCDEVDIEGYTYQSDPTDVGLAFEQVTFTSPLGDLGAWRIDSGDGTAWVIHVHGWRAGRREAVRTLPTYHAAGFTSLVIDYRNDENVAPDPTGIYRFGKSEWEDVEAAVGYAADHGATKVVLHGYSTGAALNLAFLENSAETDSVVAAISDSPNIDMAETVRHEASKRSIPGTPIPVPGSLTAVAMFIADLRWDVGWSDIDYVDRADEIVNVPMLVFHGVEDDRVPIGVSQRFRDQRPDLIELNEVPSAGHVTSWNVDPAAYEAKLTEFLDRLVN